MTYPDQSDASNVTISDVINNNGQVREGFKNKKKRREFSLTGGILIVSLYLGFL